ncbi:acyl-CoA carboxylase subunit epsilon [Streptomyces pseudovenezuelae]|uniref:acyl-CoA carboxylase subunit epsilon n=1 Tax=Streptomyces pseudovenezuelae TaxID=67350 RepID=UPI0034A2D955
MKKAETLLRVERGRASEEDLAAVAVVLLTLRARGTREPTQPTVPGWNWWQKPNGYAPPDSWR